ncbi:DNA ligase [Actinidia rufa]|uniref:DNA ligase n=1 Tax=Actinidia rufa TaxID=165716 RepID=A0A7J0DQG1_9ERIC|nr:DNA ligase [Actinidia rufa]
MNGMVWDYFFMVKNMLGSSMNQTDDVVEERDEMESEVFDERFNGKIEEVELKTPEKVVAGPRVGYRGESGGPRVGYRGGGDAGGEGQTVDAFEHSPA